MPLRRLTSRGHALDAQRETLTQPGTRGVRLLWVAEPVLLLVNRLKVTTSVPDLSRLRERIAEVLRDFQASALSEGVAASRVAQASEVLRALIDHVVTSMPWGAEAGWQSLSATGSPGGSRPAQRLLDLARTSSSDAGMQELIAVAVSLGFDRRGREAGDPYVDQLLALLAAPGQKRAHAERGLSPDGHSPVADSIGTSWLPVWVSSLVVAALLAGLYFALQVSLGIRSDRVYTRLAGMSFPSINVSRSPAASPRLAGILSGPISAHEVVVRDEIDRSVIVLPGSTLFEVGSATLQPAAMERLRPMAAALQANAGRIRVIGHTDGAVTRSARYPSDWEFSVDRARVVEEALRSLGVEAARLSHDGRANIEPLPAGGATGFPGGDGRIEIVLLVGR